MSDLINKYPYTDFHAVNLDYILKVVRENAGLHLEVSGNQLLLKTADNTIISAITIPYATEAGSANTANSASYASSAGSASSASYASSAGSAATATNATNAAHALTADTATSATSAASATNADHATTADSATNATNAVNAQTAAYAETTGNVAKAGNGIKAAEVSNSGQLWIDLENGGSIACDIKRAKSAEKDSNANVIANTYIASVIDDNGVLKFKNANGAVLFAITPSSQVANTDDYGNTIANYIKAITTAAGSNYLTITHGNGTSETILIPYSDTAWKDTNGNVIKNFYAGSMEIVEDAQTGHYNLVVYNGDTPKAELYRFEILAYKAQEAEEADHAAEADHALTADSATTATVADTCKNTNIYIKAHKDSSGSWSSSDPDSLIIESITNSAGESLTLSDLEIEDITNIVLAYHDGDSDPYMRYYSISEYQKPDTNSPITLNFDHCYVEYDSGTQKNVLSSFHADIVYRNGSLLTSSTYITNDTLS